MSKRTKKPLRSLSEVPAVRDAAGALLDAVAEELRSRALSPAAYARAVQEVGRLRGRELFYPLLNLGAGRGARAQLADGRVVLDFIGGIGVYGFGHSDRDLLETAVITAACDNVFQGHLMPGLEYLNLSRALRRHAGHRLRHVWLALSGAMANENALKLILQKHHPADFIVTFAGGFAGRTLALAELTDKPSYREGLPLSGRALIVPFYNPRDPQSTAASVAALNAHLARYPGRIAAMLFELVQGEGGINVAPREFFAALMQRCQEAGLAVWVDEVQTFGRTGELFAFQTFDLEPFVDVVTAGKLLQGSAVLFTHHYNPRPGLIAGTNAGASVGMAVAARIIERLESEGYLGSEGRIAVLGRRIARRFELLAKRMPKAVSERSGIGAMHAFVPWDGNPETVNAVLRTALEEGLLVFSAGGRALKVRLLPPVNVTDEELEAGFAILEKALRRVGEERGLPC